MGRTISKLKSIVGSALMLFAVVIAAIPAVPAYAAPANPPGYCASGVPKLNNVNFGTEIPVILVHGLQGDDKNWGSINDPSSFAGRINNTPGVAVAHRFDYNWNNWVTDSDNGPRLAKTIDCVAQLSSHNGGKGKVIVVGYSMGGLMARDALSRNVGQRSVASEVDQVITIGTPHAGANVTPWCGVAMVHICKWFVPGSPEMTALPQFPSNTTVHTIAGDVVRIYYNDKKQEVDREQPYDDTLVGVISAHAAYTIDVNKGGGSTTVSCEKKFDPKGPWGIFGYKDRGLASCEHGQLIQNASNGVREDTIAAIQKYVAWLNTPPAPETYTAGTITVKFDDRWENVGYGASGPDGDILGQDTTNPENHASVLITNMAQFCPEDQTIAECATAGNTWPVVGPAPAITVGGRTPDFSVRYIQPGHTNGSRLIWCFEAEKICIDYGAGANIYLDPSAALLDLLHTATWSN